MLGDFDERLAQTSLLISYIMFHCEWFATAPAAEFLLAFYMIR